MTATVTVTVARDLPGAEGLPGEIVKRTVRHGNHLVTQVRQSDGTWWNIRIETIR